LELFADAVRSTRHGERVIEQTKRKLKRIVHQQFGVTGVILGRFEPGVERLRQMRNLVRG
jgi:hypothetical protein